MAQSNITKVVNDHLRRGQSIAQDLAVHGQTLPSRVAETFGEKQFEKPLAFLFELAGQSQQQAEDATRAADAAHLEEQTDDNVLRVERDGTARVLYGSVTRTRGVIESLLDREAARSVGFVGETPTDAMSLSRLAPLLISKVGTLPSPEDEAIVVDFAVLAEDIAKALAPLSHVLSATQADQRENETTLRDRNEKIARSTRAQNFALDLLRLCAAAVGDEDLLYRLRPNVPRAASAKPETADVA